MCGSSGHRNKNTPLRYGLGGTWSAVHTYRDLEVHFVGGIGVVVRGQPWHVWWRVQRNCREGRDVLPALLVGVGHCDLMMVMWRVATATSTDHCCATTQPYIRAAILTYRSSTCVAAGGISWQLGATGCPFAMGLAHCGCTTIMYTRT